MRGLRASKWTHLTPSIFIALAACSPKAPSVLEPRGPGAARVEPLWWLMFWISSVVFLVVLVMIAMAIRRRGQIGEPLVEESPRWGNRFVVVAGVVIPWLILTSVFLVSLKVMQGLASEGDNEALTIRVDGRMWWWDVFYPGGVRTANEIHIPAGEPVRVRLTASDVIHSFWVPQLQVKIDMIPGKTNEMWLQADKPGRYRGQCAEYCGIQHANMLFYVVAEPQADFHAWLANEARPAPAPVAPAAIRGRDVYLGSSCFGCHAVRGTTASSEFGPDLTHLARRETIASGILENNRENLRRFIVEPQTVKPGDTMPPTSFSEEDLAALLDYLEGLR